MCVCVCVYIYRAVIIRLIRYANGYIMHKQRLMKYSRPKAPNEGAKLNRDRLKNQAPKQRC